MNISSVYYQMSLVLSSNDYIIKSPIFSTMFGLDGVGLTCIQFFRKFYEILEFAS